MYGHDVLCPYIHAITCYGCHGVLVAPGTMAGVLVEPGAANGRSDGIFMVLRSIFWSTAPIFVVGRACCSITQFAKALLFNDCNVVASIGRDGSTDSTCTMWNAPFSLRMGLISF